MASESIEVAVSETVACQLEEEALRQGFTPSELIVRILEEWAEQHRRSTGPG
jgi:hypothetical protein